MGLMSTLRLLLYPVIFSPDLGAEAARVGGLFRDRSTAELARIVRDARAELARPGLEAAAIEELVSGATEEQVRSFLAGVIGQLEAILATRV